MPNRNREIGALMRDQEEKKHNVSQHSIFLTTCEAYIDLLFYPTLEREGKWIKIDLDLFRS